MEFVQTILSTPFGALTALLAVLVIGELVAKLTRGIVPAALAITVLMLAGFWTKFFPATIVESAGITTTLFAVVSAILVANLGTLISRKEMAAQWRTVIIAIMGIIAIIAVCLTIGAAIFGWSNAVAAAPPLCGAAMATAMVRQAAEAVGNNKAVLVAVVCMSVQGLFGYPITAFCLKKEAKRLSAAYKAGELKAVSAEAGQTKTDAKKPDSTNVTLFKLALITVVSMLLGLATKALGFEISMYVWALLLGFVGHEVGFLQKDCLTKSNAYGLCITILMLYLFGGLATSDPATILPTFGTAAALVLMSAAGMALMAFIASKVFKKTFSICYAIILNAFLGFPINVMLVNEALDLNTSDPDERAAVSSEIMPPMLVGSFVCVTIVSVIVAGILIKYIV